jgi:hypothetical protein
VTQNSDFADSSPLSLETPPLSRTAVKSARGERRFSKRVCWVINYEFSNWREE